MNSPTPPDHPHPRSLAELFFSFTFLALQGFGGVLAVVQLELVERKRWLTREEFIEDWAVAQIMPGPNVVNLSMMIGSRYFGLPGALAALAGMLVFPLMVVLLMALAYSRSADHPGVAAGLIIASGIKLMPALARHPLGRPACLLLAALCFGAVALLHLPLLTVLAGLGVVACVLTWRKIKP
jgi:chromate transporter